DSLITPSSTSCVTLAPAASCILVGIYQVTQGDIDVGQIDNTGTGDSDETPPGDDTVTTQITMDPRLVIDKSLESNADEDGSATITINDTLTFLIIATNTGNVTLTNVVVTDDKIVPGSITCPSVAVANTCVLTGTYVVTQNDIDNGQIINLAGATSGETGIETDTEIVVINGEPIVVIIPFLSIWAQLLMGFLFLVAVFYIKRKIY
ncbi:MAG: hypothetical protein JKX98_10500, partial [Alcanivoracaceae bacterium]|nr:hypothetical protein [Alcanivoracaceae bacterium]